MPAAKGPVGSPPSRSSSEVSIPPKVGRHRSMEQPQDTTWPRSEKASALAGTSTEPPSTREVHPG
jgi:hypothetical protein